MTHPPATTLPENVTDAVPKVHKLGFALLHHKKLILILMAALSTAYYHVVRIALALKADSADNVKAE